MSRRLRRHGPRGDALVVTLRGALPLAGPLGPHAFIYSISPSGATRCSLRMPSRGQSLRIIIAGGWFTGTLLLFSFSSGNYCHSVLLVIL